MSLCRAFSHTPLQMIKSELHETSRNSRKGYMIKICHLVRLYIVHITVIKMGGGAESWIKIAMSRYFGCVKQVSVFIAEIRLVPSLKIHVPALF